jgi:hypothetical protein
VILARTAFVAILTAVLAGCGNTVSAVVAPPTALTNPAQGRRSICVAAALGHTFHHQRVGMTVFGNAYREVAIDAWGINDAATARIASLLGTTADVHRLTITAAAVDAFEKSGTGFAGPLDERLQPIVASLAKSKKCDNYLLVTKGASNFGATNITLHGIGVVESDPPLASQITTLHAFMFLSLFDGATLQVTNMKTATMGQPTFMQMLKGPHRDLDPSWRAEPSAIAADKRYKDAVREIVEESLKQSLPLVLDVAAIRTAAAPRKP